MGKTDKSIYKGLLELLTKHKETLNAKFDVTDAITKCFTHVNNLFQNVTIGTPQVVAPQMQQQQE
jgi:hypothetical protein